MTPYTGGGRALAIAAALSGIVVIAMPIAVVGTQFTALYNVYIESQKQRLLRLLDDQAARGRPPPVDRRDDARRAHALAGAPAPPLGAEGGRRAAVVDEHRQLARESCVWVNKGYSRECPRAPRAGGRVCGRT